MHSMRPNEHLGSETLNDVAVLIEFINRVVRFEFPVGIHAVETKTAAPRRRQGTGLIASNKRPDTLAVNIDVH